MRVWRRRSKVGLRGCLTRLGRGGDMENVCMHVFRDDVFFFLSG